MAELGTRAANSRGKQYQAAQGCVPAGLPKISYGNWGGDTEEATGVGNFAFT